MKIGYDMHAVTISRKGLRKAVEFARLHPDLFSADRSGESGLLKRYEKMTVWSTWGNILDYVMSLDKTGGYHRDYPRISDPSGKRASFLVAYASFLAEYRYALEFLELTKNNPLLDTILNEEVPELGLPAGSYAGFKFRFLNVQRAAEFAAMQLIDKLLPGGNNTGEISRAIEDDAAVIWEMGKGKGAAMTMQNAEEIVRKAGFAAWFPVQKGISKLMGDVRVRRKGTSLISEEQIHTIVHLLQPGDILLQRREWYLSNLGLPGFWTHAALYIGTEGERRTFFDDEEVRKWLRSQDMPDGDFEKLLSLRYPDAYTRSIERQGDGNLPRVLEAVSEGVIFTTLEHSASADSLAVLRPRLSKQEKAVALFRAFHYSGRPYDFNFDFLTDSSLVCSELVYKVYEPAPDFDGLNFSLLELMGRKMATPNSMAQQFYDQFNTEEQQTNLVLFLDGYDRAGRAVEATVEEFRQSWQRPKWHVLFQENPEDIKK